MAAPKCPDKTYYNYEFTDNNEKRTDMRIIMTIPVLFSSLFVVVIVVVGVVIVNVTNRYTKFTTITVRPTRREKT